MLLHMLHPYKCLNSPPALLSLFLSILLHMWSEVLASLPFVIPAVLTVRIPSAGAPVSMPPSQLSPHCHDPPCRRPGVLVLINESDWELLGMLEAELSEGDNVVFISTLHGG